MVAPHTGAWIETDAVGTITSLNLSHPTRVRGLKLKDGVWHADLLTVAPHTGAWIETLNYNLLPFIFGRTPHGCVD